MQGLPLYAGVLLAALGESTALVGLLVPGVGIVVAASALAARGDGNLVAVALLASVGSVAGFGLSYHLGRAGGKRLAAWRLRAPTAFGKAEAFLSRFGGWAVFWGHFFGPVRACVALVAGAGGLSPTRFWTASVAGALAWGFGLAATGAALSGGWRIVEGTLGRGSLLVVGFVTVLYVSVRISAGALALGLHLLASASKWVTDALTRSTESPGLRAVGAEHPFLRPWLQKRLSPDRATGLLLWASAATCLGFAVLFLGGAKGILFREPLARLDLNLFHLLQTLHSWGGDRFFLWVTYLGSGPVLITAGAAGAGALVALRRRFEAGLLLVGFGSGELLMWFVERVFGPVRSPPSPITVSEALAGLPSNHAFSSVALFGFLCYLFTRGLRPPTRARLAAWTGVVVATVGVSELYLGTCWASDEAVGWFLGGIWLLAQITGAEVGYRFGARRPTMRVGTALAWGAGVLSVVALVWVSLAAREVPKDFARLLPTGSPVHLSAADLLPTLRELAGSPVETLTGDPLGRVGLFVLSAESALRGLEPGPWSATADLRVPTLFQRWAQAWRGSVAAGAPVYPRFWRGRPQELSLSLSDGQEGRRVARCWKTGFMAKDGSEIWAIWLREERAPRRLFGVPVPGLGRRARGFSETEALTGPLLASGKFVRVAAPDDAPFHVLERAPNAGN